MNKTKEPLFHISRRKEIAWYKAWSIRIVTIIVALFVCGIITTATTGLNPINVYGSMLNGAFGT